MNSLLHPPLRCCWRLLKPSKTFDTYITSLDFSTSKSNTTPATFISRELTPGGYFYIKPGSDQRQLYLNLNIPAQSPTRPTPATLTK